MKYHIRKVKNRITDDAIGFSVYAGHHRIEVAMGEPNWFENKKDAELYMNECMASYNEEKEGER
jgi:hypothetical protein